VSSGLLLLFLIIDAPGLESSFTSLYRTIKSVEKDLDKEAKALRYLSIAIKRSWAVVAFAVRRSPFFPLLLPFVDSSLALSRQGIIWITNWLITIVVVVQTSLVYIWKRETSESIVSGSTPSSLEFFASYPARPVTKLALNYSPTEFLPVQVLGSFFVPSYQRTLSLVR